MNKHWSILYVDDDYDSCQLIPIWLSKNGDDFEVTALEDSKEAVSVIDQKSFDLYLLDYCIPDITGVALCKMIRAKHPNAPIIFYSALDRDVDRAMAAKAGANLFLVKPDDIGHLVPSIKKMLRSSSTV